METQLSNLSPSILEMETQVSQKGKAVETEINPLEKETLMEDDDNGNDINNDKQITLITVAEPIRGFPKTGEPHFLKKLRKIVEDPETDNIISWSVTKESVMIWNSYEFCTKVLPRFFKHNNLPSFIRQLNHYGFKKMNRAKDPSEYAHKDFQGGKEHLWNSSKNKDKGGSSNLRFNLNQSCLEAKLEQLKDKMNKQIMEKNSNPNLDMDPSVLQAEMEKLKSYTNTMEVEIMELKVKQESIRSYLVAMKKRVEKNNKHKKEQIRTLLEKALANPAFASKFTQLVKEKMGFVCGQIAKKQRTEDPQSSNNLVSFNGVENGENANEEEVITVERRDEKPVSGPVEQKAEEIVEWGNWDLISRDSMFWNTIIVDEMNNEIEAKAEAEMENYWREKKIFVE